MNEQAVRFRLGIFVLASLILLAVLIILFGGTPSFFKPSHIYYINVDDATGVSTGTPVRRRGVKIGEVESVKLDEETGKVVVTIRVDSKYSIPTSEQAWISPESVVSGDYAIVFKPAKQEEQPVIQKDPPQQQPAAQPQQPKQQNQQNQQKKKEAKKGQQFVPPGSTIQGRREITPQEMMQLARKVLVPAEDAMKEVKKVFEKLDKMTPVMEQTLKEYQKLAANGNKLTPEISKTNDAVQKLVKNVDKLAPEVGKTNDEIQKLAKSSRQMIPELKKTNDQIQLTARNWGRVGERMDILLQTNEKKLVKSLEQLEKALTQVNKVFSDDNLKNLSTTLENTARGSKKLDNIIRSTDALLRESQDTVGKIGQSVEKADKVFTNLEKVTKPMAQRSESILKNLDEATGELNKATSEIRILMRAVARNEGTVQKLLTDPSLYNRLDKAAAGINRVLPRLDHILRDVETFADRLARHPELIGIGGVVRPSNGLKDLPVRPIYRQSRQP